MTIHRLKTRQPHFNDVLSGLKPFEYRRDDRTPPFLQGDLLTLYEIDDDQRPTGRELEVYVTTVLRGEEAEAVGVPRGYCVLGIARHPWTLVESISTYLFVHSSWAFPACLSMAQSMVSEALGGPRMKFDEVAAEALERQARAALEKHRATPAPGVGAPVLMQDQARTRLNEAKAMLNTLGRQGESWPPSAVQFFAQMQRILVGGPMVDA